MHGPAHTDHSFFSSFEVRCGGGGGVAISPKKPYTAKFKKRWKNRVIEAVVGGWGGGEIVQLLLTIQVLFLMLKKILPKLLPTKIKKIMHNLKMRKKIKPQRISQTLPPPLIKVIVRP